MKDDEQLQVMDELFALVPPNNLSTHNGFSKSFCWPYEQQHKKKSHFY